MIDGHLAFLVALSRFHLIQSQRQHKFFTRAASISIDAGDLQDMAICAPSMIQPDAKLIPLHECSPAAVETLLDAAFGADRHGRTAYRLRAGTDAIAQLSFGIERNGELIGSVQCWPVQVADGARAFPLVLVGPVAVHPDHQMSGHGHKLMRAAMNAAATAGDPAMVMIGDEEYYGRFGFTAAATAGWMLPGPWQPHRLLCRNPAGHKLPATGMVGPRGNR